MREIGEHAKVETEVPPTEYVLCHVCQLATGSEGLMEEMECDY